MNAQNPHESMGSEHEGSMSFLVMITCVAALGGLLFGYDTGVISGAIGFLEAGFELSPEMVGWVASCALVGCMVGVAFAGTLADRFGRKKMDKHPYLVDQFNHGFPFFVYGFFCVVTVVFVWKVAPETKGKSLEQIEKMWLREKRS